MIKHGIAAVAAVSLLAGCATDSGGQKVAVGAVVGAAAGAGVGALIGNRKGALIGAGIGAIAGAGIGAYLAEQERKLKRDLEGTGATVVNTGDDILITLPAGVLFPVDSATIQPRFEDKLVSVANTLKADPRSLIDVVGHTDSTGDAAYNQDLSERRANSVATFLKAEGVRSSRIVAYGRGETEPIATNATAEGRALNRRVEIRVTPLTE